MVWSSAPRNIASRMPITMVRTPAWSSGLGETARWGFMEEVDPGRWWNLDRYQPAVENDARARDRRPWREFQHPRRQSSYERWGALPLRHPFARRESNKSPTSARANRYLRVVR